jgi:hypothetical protein
MNLRLRALQVYVPASIRRNALEQLFRITADAFGCGPPSTAGMRHQEMLRRYAAFTRDRADQVIMEGREHSVLADRLWRNAYRLGMTLRRRLRIRTTEEALTAARIVYRILDIDFRGNRRGDIVIERCSFSAVYSPAVCRIVSSLDAGLLAGLTDGGRLTFSTRITEGWTRCLARVTWEGPRT